MPGKPIDIAGLRKRGVDVSVPFFGAEITVTYDPITVISDEFRDQWEARRKELSGELADWQRSLSDQLKGIPLKDDFPGVDLLMAAGIETVGDVPTQFADLTQIRGIGPVTARQIINEINNDGRVDDLEFGRRRQLIWAEMALMLVRDWNLEESGQKLPLETESLTTLPGLAESICQEVWRHANSLGNPNSSRRTR